jgi:hypothetical protein
MFTDLNRNCVHNISYMTKLIGAAEVHLNTPVRPNNCKPLQSGEMEAIRRDWFWNVKTARCVYRDARPEVSPTDAAEAESRHPTKPKPTESTVAATEPLPE